MENIRHKKNNCEEKKFKIQQKSNKQKKITNYTFNC